MISDDVFSPHKGCNDKFPLPGNNVGRNIMNLNLKQTAGNFLDFFASVTAPMEKKEESDGQMTDGGVRLIGPNVDFDTSW